MNERIKQLMLKAGGVLAPAYVTDADGNSIWTDNAKVDTIDMDGEYFAKLLVRECADAADMAHDARCEYVGDYVAEYMGYGVEEGVAAWRAK